MPQPLHSICQSAPQGLGLAHCEALHTVTTVHPGLLQLLPSKVRIYWSKHPITKVHNLHTVKEIAFYNLGSITQEQFQLCAAWHQPFTECKEVLLVIDLANLKIPGMAYVAVSRACHLSQVTGIMPP